MLFYFIHILGFWGFGVLGFWGILPTRAYIYVETQGGEVERENRVTHESRSIKPYARYGEKKLRFNWNAPLVLSPNEKGTIYIGAQFVFRSRDHGQSWERISPDLTTNDPEKQKQEESGGVTVDNSVAEMHTTVYSIPSRPRTRNLFGRGPTMAMSRSRGMAASTGPTLPRMFPDGRQGALGFLGENTAQIKPANLADHFALHGAQ